MEHLLNVFFGFHEHLSFRFRSFAETEPFFGTVFKRCQFSLSRPPFLGPIEDATSFIAVIVKTRITICSLFSQPINNCLIFRRVKLSCQSFYAVIPLLLPVTD